jgi:hypothetical protein
MKSFTKTSFALTLGGVLIATASFAASHTAKSNNAAVNARHAQM